MKKLLLLVLIFYCFKLQAQVPPVQNNTAFSIGAELTIPSYGLYSIGTGLSAKFETPIVSPFSLSITGGFTSVFYKSNLLYIIRPAPAQVCLPLDKSRTQYYLVQSVYAEGEAGTAIELNHNKQDLFSFSFGQGFLAPIGENRAIDISFR